MIFEGRVFKYGDDVNTDVIIPARYLNTSDPEELASHCMEDIDTEFLSKMKPGDIIVAGNNFGCGSSREHAPIAIKASKVSCVIAASFARIFYRNSINIGLPILEAPEAASNIRDGDIIRVDTEKGEIKNITCEKLYKTIGYPDFLQQIIEAGGLMKFAAKEIKHDA
jgi:3-isopropylmalate/(R)-2-methylmalate dehydratase small subunit